MKVFEALAKALTDHDVSTLFGLIGDGNLFMADSFAREPSTRYVAAGNEAGAVLMANGYASVSGRLGVVTVTHGPGLANALPPLIDSVRSRMPLLVVAGDTGSEDQKTLQKIPQRQLVAPTGAGFEQVRAPRTAVQDLATAVRRALVERRPIVLNVPVDFMWEDVTYVRAGSGYAGPQAVVPDSEALEAVVGVLAGARRPIVLGGRGASTPRARAALLRLAERVGAPVACTVRGLDLFRGEPFDLGLFGTSSSQVALETIGRSDCVVAFGATLNPWTTDSGALLEGKRLIQVDIDPSVIGQHLGVDAAVIGDSATSAEAMVHLLDEADIRASGFRSADLAQRLSSLVDAENAGERAGDDPVDLRLAMSYLDKILPQDRVVVMDAGRFMFEAYKLMHVARPTDFVHTCNFGSIGLGMGNAIGAAVAAPDRPVLLVCGDGGFMLGGLAEFTSAVRNRVDLIVMVMNDGSYGAEHIQFRNRDMDPALTTFEWPEFAPLAVALGGDGKVVRTAGDLKVVEQALERRDRPLLIDVKLDPDSVPFEGY